MENSTPSSTASNNLQWLVIAFLIISFLGFADASYLTIEHFLGATPNCSLLEGCEVVTTSSYSEIFNIPIALGGSIYYISLFFLALAYLDTKKERLLKTAALLSPLGLCTSVYLVSIMAFVLNAWCIYCLGSAISSTLLFILGMIILKKISH